MWEVEGFRQLYVEQGLTLSAIAELHGCSLTTVWRWLKAAGIERREGGSGPKYVRTDFSGEPGEMASLIGFRIGDLHVAMEGSRTVVVKCTSTRAEQIELFRQLFERCGHVYTDEATLTRRRRQTIGMGVRLNMTFAFLLPKQDAVPEWVLANDEAFFAGYVDAEGYFHTYHSDLQPKPQARLEVRTYDVKLLTQLSGGPNAKGGSSVPQRDFE